MLDDLPGSRVMDSGCFLVLLWLSALPLVTVSTVPYHHWGTFLSLNLVG